MDAETRQLTWARAKQMCEYCCMPQQYDRLRFQIDHVVAEQHGGDDASDNLALACLACNNHKGPNIAGVDPETGEIARLYHPRRDHWSEHFEWRGPELIGLTAIGRVTVYVLAINTNYRVALRRSLIDEGVFPRT